MTSCTKRQGVVKAGVLCVEPLAVHATASSQWIAQSLTVIFLIKIGRADFLGRKIPAIAQVLLSRMKFCACNQHEQNERAAARTLLHAVQLSVL